MHIRLSRLLAAGLGLAAGVALPVGAIDADAARLIVTFMGLVAASVLPTVSLLVNSITANGHSVHSLQRLGGETKQAIGALFVVLALSGASVLALLILETPTLWTWPLFLSDVEVRLHIGQAITLMLIAEAVNRTRVIPRSIYKCLALKVDISVEEARRSIAERAPKAGDAGAAFGGRPGFGAVRKLEDVRAG